MICLLRPSYEFQWIESENMIYTQKFDATCCTFNLYHLEKYKRKNYQEMQKNYCGFSVILSAT